MGRPKIKNDEPMIDIKLGIHQSLIDEISQKLTEIDLDPNMCRSKFIRNAIRYYIDTRAYKLSHVPTISDLNEINSSHQTTQMQKMCEIQTFMLNAIKGKIIKDGVPKYSAFLAKFISEMIDAQDISDEEIRDIREKEIIHRCYNVVSHDMKKLKKFPPYLNWMKWAQEYCPVKKINRVITE